jgi:hypothetical protein
MEESSKKIVATLNDLIEINHDRREGYKVAVAELNDRYFRNYLPGTASKAKPLLQSWKNR